MRSEVAAAVFVFDTGILILFTTLVTGVESLAPVVLFRVVGDVDGLLVCDVSILKAALESSPKRSPQKEKDEKRKHN